MILLDANVLLRLANQEDLEYKRAQRFVFSCRKKDLLVVSPQTLFEFWAVATRSRQVNGIGMEITRAKQWLTVCKRIFPMLDESPEIVSIWESLVEKFGVKGFRAHDARYVAMMQLHGIDQFMTYNVKHFSCFPINILDPAASESSN